MSIDSAADHHTTSIYHINNENTFIYVAQKFQLFFLDES